MAEAEQALAETGGGDQLGDIIVTTRRIAEDVQKVPLTINTVTAETLTQASASSLQDISFLTPGLTYTSNGAEANAQPTIRGLSDTSGGEATSSNVSIFFDGIYIANASAIDFGVGGLERVEVVEGPVSGLYGRNAFTGAINYVSAKPTPNFQTDDAVTIGDDGRYIGEINLSGPLIGDILTARVAATYDHLDGTFQDPVSKVYGNGHRKEDLLASLLFKPIEGLSFTPVFYYGHDYFTSPVSVTYAQNCAIGTSNSYCGDLNQNQIGPYLASNEGSGDAGLKRHVVHGHIDIKADYDWGAVSVLAGYDDIRTASINEFDGTENGIPYTLYLPGANNPFAGNRVVGTALAKNFFGAESSERDKSVEVRYDSPRDLRLRGAVGGYYYYNIQTYDNTFGIDGQNIPAGNVLNFIAQGYVTSNGQSARPLNKARNGARDYSGFVSLDFDILPDLTLSGVVRDTAEKQTSVNSALKPLAATFHSVTSNESLNWKITPDIVAYVSAANGEKSGGFNFAALSAIDATFLPETDWNYEAGIKTTLLDHHLKLNVSAFHTELNQLQVLGPPQTPGAIGLVVTNFGNATANGFEVTADYVDGSGFNIGGGVSYSDPTFDDGSVDFNDATACARIPACAPRIVTVKGIKGVDISGLRPPYQSNWTVTTTVGYHQELPALPGVDWFVRADYRYESEQYNTVTNFAHYGPRNVLNLHAGLENDNWTLTGYVLNLTDDETPVTNQFNGTLNGFDAPPVGVYGVNWIPTSVLPEGRTFAFRLAYHFAAAAAPPPLAETPAPPPAAPAAPAPGPQPEAQREFQVFFDFDKSDITEAAARVIESAASVVKSGGVAHITVTGHTDTVGSAAYNQGLSERRAASVKTALVADGVPGGEVTTVGVGKSGELVPTADGVREAQNRRAVIDLM